MGRGPVFDADDLFRGGTEDVARLGGSDTVCDGEDGFREDAGLDDPRVPGSKLGLGDGE